MRRLEPPDTHFLSAAVGWLGLGNVAEAEAELSQLSQSALMHPDVLETRWLICAEQKRWDKGLELAQALIKRAPRRASGWLHQAYALRRLPDGGLKKAWDALLPAFEKFPDEPTIPFNLSCYACQMRQIDLARTWLKRAAQIGGKEYIRRLALTDPDLEPIRDDVSKL